MQVDPTTDLEANAAMPRPSPADTLFGDKSLSERFGNLEGRELLDKVFDYYQVGGRGGN